MSTSIVPRLGSLGFGIILKPVPSFVGELERHGKAGEPVLRSTRGTDGLPRRPLCESTERSRWNGAFFFCSNIRLVLGWFSASESLPDESIVFARLDSLRSPFPSCAKSCSCSSDERFLFLLRSLLLAFMVTIGLCFPLFGDKRISSSSSSVTSPSKLLLLVVFRNFNGCRACKCSWICELGACRRASFASLSGERPSIDGLRAGKVSWDLVRLLSLNGAIMTSI
jgi:hypothetical protein